jgi:hypothetical protein
VLPFASARPRPARTLADRVPVRALALIVAVAAIVSAPGTAWAAADDTVDDARIRWSVSPSDANGPDGRTAAEHTLDPGESVEDFFAVRNVSDADVTFALTAADGFFTRNGRFDILASGEESVDSGTWITVPEAVSVPAGETVVVPYRLEVPDQAEPGDHAAGITASVLSIGAADDGTSVGVESRVGFRVLTRVTGEITPVAELTAVDGSYGLSWNPFRPGEITVSFEVVNEGNTRLLVGGRAAAGGGVSVFPADGTAQELLPGDERPFTAVIDGVWPLFLVPTTVTVAAESVTMDGASSEVAPVRAEISVWAVPWPQLAVLVGVALVVGAVIGGRLRSRRRLNALLAQAREEGRRSVAGASE